MYGVAGDVREMDVECIGGVGYMILGRLDDGDVVGSPEGRMRGLEKGERGWGFMSSSRR